MFTNHKTMKTHFTETLLHIILGSVVIARGVREEERESVR